MRPNERTRSACVSAKNGGVSWEGAEPNQAISLSLQHASAVDPSGGAVAGVEQIECMLPRFAPLDVTLLNHALQLLFGYEKAGAGKPSFANVVLPAPLTEKPMTNVFTRWLALAAVASWSATCAALFG